MSNPAEWFENHPLFFKELGSGFFWTVQVAAFLAYRGLDVKISERGVRDYVGQTDKYKKMVSFWCEGAPVDVKSRSETFYRPADFRYPQIFVNEVENFRAKTVKPEFIVCVSQATGSMIVLDVPGTCTAWKIRADRDSVRETKKERITAHRDLWVPAATWVTRMQKRKAAAVHAARPASNRPPLLGS